MNCNEEHQPAPTNPQADFQARHPVGSRVTGKVLDINDFGFFVGFDFGVRGFVHVSDIPGEAVEPASVVRKGQLLEVVVAHYQPDGRIQLSLKG